MSSFMKCMSLNWTKKSHRSNTHGFILLFNAFLKATELWNNSVIICYVKCILKRSKRKVYCLLVILFAYSCAIIWIISERLLRDAWLFLTNSSRKIWINRFLTIFGWQEMVLKIFLYILWLFGAYRFLRKSGF